MIVSPNQISRGEIMNSIWRYLVIAVLAMLLVACGSGGGSTQPQLATPAYFVSPGGSDANPGTVAQPWQTLNYAATKLKAGDTLYARAGVYAETVWVGNSGTAASPITITAYPGESPIIDGSTLNVNAWSSLLLLRGSYIIASGFEIRNINLNGAVLGGFGVGIEGTNDIVSNMIVHHTWSHGIEAQGDYSIVQDSTIYNVALANCRLAQAACGVTTTIYGSALYPGSGGWPSCVSASRPYNSGLINHNSTIQRVTVYDCWGEGISTWNSKGTIIQDNITYNNFSENLYVNNTVNALVQRNIVYNAPESYLGSYAPTAGFALADEQNNTLPTPASNLGTYNTVINNFIYNSDVSLYSWTQVSGTGLNNALFANNTIINSNFATGAGGSNNIINISSIIANNIVSGGYVTVPSAAGLTFSNNLWTTSPPNAYSPSDVIGNPQLAATGNTGPGQLSADYFKLLAGSPAIGKGMSLTQVPADFFGTPRKPASSIGGYESP